LGRGLPTAPVPRITSHYQAAEEVLGGRLNVDMERRVESQTRAEKPALREQESFFSTLIFTIHYSLSTYARPHHR
jgi:hypothetical protein